MDKELFIGVMSGTSVDGIDICLSAIQNSTVQLIDWQCLSFTANIKTKIKALCLPSENEIFRAHSLGIELSLLTADQINTLLLRNALCPKDIHAIGYHGQTIRHHPDLNHPFSIQIGCGSTLAHHTKINTITDFRMADIAAGGQGAPLVPAFHQAVFHSPKENRFIINVGGIANITLIPADLNKAVCGFDTGPGNTLLDEWIYTKKLKDFDKDGEWARSGTTIPKLFKLMMEDSYINKQAPKSTGKEYFNLSWLNLLLKDFPKAKAEDVQRTLTEFTCVTICRDIKTLLQNYDDSPSSIYLCGGGINNTFLFERLDSQIPELEIKSTIDLGIHPQLVEASAFAWLASRTALGKPGNLKSVTGANQDKVLGCIYHP
ncbi:MAG: anhydro-N-acetylmuramic acid kinase [Oleiphilaceae bacterium]|jgi:anhydro-N-acetylmuramic acid kinase